MNHLFNSKMYNYPQLYNPYIISFQSYNEFPANYPSSYPTTIISYYQNSSVNFILVAILILASIDLIFIRPQKSICYSSKE